MDGQETKTKVCARCGIEKSVGVFWKSKRHRDGFQSYCKYCANEKNIEWCRKHGIKPRQIKQEYVLPEFKICTRCKIEKPKSDFRVRLENRLYKGKFPYLNNTCKKCDAELSKEYLKQLRSSPEGRKKNNASARACYKRRRDKALAQMKKKRQTDEYKIYRREYRQRNKEKIYEQEVITKKRYHRKHRDNLTDRYIIRLFRNNGKPDPTPQQINEKRKEIIRLRVLGKVGKRVKVIKPYEFNRVFFG